MREWWEDFWPVVVMGVVVVLIIGFVLVAPSIGKRTRHECVVVDRVYVPSSTNTGVGPAIGTNGQVSVVVMTSYSSEKYVVIGKDELGNIFHVDVTVAQWARLEKGKPFVASSHWTGYYVESIP